MNLPPIKVSVIPSISIFVRHSLDCPRKRDELYRNCRCPKHLRYTHDGKQHRQSAKTRTWSVAEQRRREIEDKFRAADPGKPVAAVSLLAESRPTIERAVQLFLTDKKSQGLDSTAHKKHERELGRLESFMAKRGKLFPEEISLEDLTEFRAGWVGLYPSSTTRAKVQERLRGFLRYCLHAKLIDQVPKLSPIKVAESPTLPLTDGQYKKLLEAVFIEFAASDKARRLHALIRLMRYSGLAIQDAVTLEPDEMRHDIKKNIYRVITSRQKTGTHVSVPLPPDVAEEVIAVKGLNGNPQYIFWNRSEGKPKAAVDVWERAFKRVFKRAGISKGHSHQLRDTFAVGLLQEGVPMEEVSKLLGHTSIKTTEKSYSPWVTARQDRLDSLVMATFQGGKTQASGERKRNAAEIGHH